MESFHILAKQWYQSLPVNWIEKKNLFCLLGQSEEAKKAKALIVSYFETAVDMIDAGIRPSKAVEFVVRILEYPTKFHSAHFEGEMWEYENGKISKVLVPGHTGPFIVTY